MSTETKIFTWGDLKKKVNELPDEMLSIPVRWWGEERGGLVGEILLLSEIYVQDDEGFSPLSSFEEEGDAYYEGSELPKGCPIISVDK